jgi:Glycosyltransferase
MRVFIINSFFSIGGPPRIVKGIYDTLIENGHECILAAGREKPIPGMNVYKIGTPINKYWHFIMSSIFDAQGFSSKHATKKLIAKIADYKPDIINLHNLHGYYINVDILFNYLERTNIPVVWTFHDCWAITGHCCHYDYIGCYKWADKNGCDNCPQKYEYPKCYILDNSKKNCRKKKDAFKKLKNLYIITVSNWLNSQIKKSFLSDYPIKTIYNGINLEEFQPTKNSIKQKYNITGKILLLGVAQNWSDKKGINDFIELSKKLGDDYKIIIVGISDNLIKELPETIIKINKTDNITQLCQYYTAADVVLNLSVEETFGLVTVEALACGTPVILYNKTALPEIIDSKCGIVIEKECEIDNLVAAVCEKEYLKLLPADCINQAKKFNIDVMSCNYYNLFKTIIKNV